LNQLLVLEDIPAKYLLFLEITVKVKNLIKMMEASFLQEELMVLFDAGTQI
jgi:hypothetical protein